MMMMASPKLYVLAIEIFEIIFIRDVSMSELLSVFSSEKHPNVLLICMC
jgi:hypothetical protein